MDWKDIEFENLYGWSIMDIIDIRIEIDIEEPIMI
jgi:hypothetical protein